jgi:hypothetical protein
MPLRESNKILSSLPKAPVPNTLSIFAFLKDKVKYFLFKKLVSNGRKSNETVLQMLHPVI